MNKTKNVFVFYCQNITQTYIYIYIERNDLLGSYNCYY